MKIGSPPPSFVHDPARASGRRPQAAETDAPGVAAPNTKAEEAGGRKALPPGLERVQARLQGLGERTAGQATALDRISRNIARYQETQALATPPTPEPEVSPLPTPAASAEAGPAEPATVASTEPAPEPAAPSA